MKQVRFYTYEEDKLIVKQLGKFYSQYRNPFLTHLSTEAGLDNWQVNPEVDVARLFYNFGVRGLKVVFPDQL